MLFESIQQSLKESMIQRDEIKVSTLRLLISEIRNTQIAKGHDLSDDEIIEVIQKEAKKRKESIEGFTRGDRLELAAKEAEELKILEGYLPEQMNDEELIKLVDEAITEIGASSMADMGKVIGIVMGKAKGQVDGSRVSGIAKEKLC